MDKLLVICGPTATGKTELGVRLAKKIDGEIVSADSRQVYRGLDIATGKDLLAYGDVPVWMLDVVRPTQQFSVALYRELAVRVIREVWERKKLPVLVGGTGLYIKAVVDGIETAVIPPSKKLRKKYEGKSADELFSVLSKIDSKKAQSLNDSDRKNPRRLIRAIEIASHFPPQNPHSHIPLPTSSLMIGLTASPDILKGKIETRIAGWVKEGAEGEVRKLIASGVSWDTQAMNAIGYREWRPFFERKAGGEEVVTQWKKDEWQYVRRQLTWFKRDKRIVWFDITKNGWGEKVERLVKEWYDKSS